MNEQNTLSVLIFLYILWWILLNEPQYLQKGETVKTPHPKELQVEKSIVF